MRIVAVADTHLYQAELSLPEGDVFVHAGDLLRAGTFEELRTVLPWLRALPYRHKLIVAGNHDVIFQRERQDALELLGDDIVYLEDSGVSVDGVRFWGSPWQPIHNDWAFNLPRGAALAEKWSRIPEGTQVLITHGPPEGLGDCSRTSGRQGCADLLQAVLQRRPWLHLFGHIHQDGGAWDRDGTLFVNVTTWESERQPTVLDLDPRTGRIDRVSVPSSLRERYD